MDDLVTNKGLFSVHKGEKQTLVLLGPERSNLSNKGIEGRE
jgi:hypothetical protein